MKVVEVRKKSAPKFPHMVGTRFAPDEFEKIQDMAAAAGMSLCAYVRTRALGGHIKSRIDKTAIDGAINELRMTKGLMKTLHNEGQKIPYPLVRKCEQAIERFIEIDPIREE